MKNPPPVGVYEKMERYLEKQKIEKDSRIRFEGAKDNLSAASANLNTALNVAAEAAFKDVEESRDEARVFFQGVLYRFARSLGVGGRYMYRIMIEDVKVAEPPSDELEKGEE